MAAIELYTPQGAEMVSALWAGVIMRLKHHLVGGYVPSKYCNIRRGTHKAHWMLNPFASEAVYTRNFFSHSVFWELGRKPCQHATRGCDKRWMTCIQVTEMKYSNMSFKLREITDGWGNRMQAGRILMWGSAREETGSVPRSIGLWDRNSTDLFTAQPPCFVFNTSPCYQTEVG